MANQEGQRGQDQGAGETGSGRGFAGMDDDKQRDIAAEGGRSVPDDKRSFSQDRELASEAGQKGGEASAGRSDGGDRGQGGQAGSSGASEQTRQDDDRFAGSDDIEQGGRQ